MSIMTYRVRTPSVRLGLDTVRMPAVQGEYVPNDTRIDIRLPEDERELFFNAAKADGLPLSLWLRRIAKKEARKVLGDGQQEKGKKAR